MNPKQCNAIIEQLRKEGREFETDDYRNPSTC